MNPEHREIIKIKRDYLIENVPFDAVMPSLMKSRMFNKYMWEDIHSMSDVLDFLPFRGPTAFQSMIEVLKSAGYNREAAALESPDRDEAGDTDHVHYYKMSSKPLGYCLIINNVDFVKELETRHGSDVDAKSLEDFFKTDFEVFPEKNLTADQMKSSLDTFSKNDFNPVDCMIVVILSHGGQINGLNFIYGTDGKMLHTEEIYNMFNNKKEGLQNKPKIFFFVACRGAGMDYGVPKTFPKESIDCSKAISSTNSSLMPSRDDYFVYHSTLPNEYSIRDWNEGSYFIRALVPILKKYHLEEDLESMMNRVNSELSVTRSETFCAFQIPHTQKIGNRGKIMLCRRK